MPSLPVTDDGSAGPLTEDLSSGSGDGEDITWDAETAEAGGVPAAAGTESRDGEGGGGSGMAGPDAAPAIGESGRWFRPAKAKKDYVPIPPEEPTEPGSAGLDVAPADPEPGRAVATQDAAEPDGAEATQARPAEVWTPPYQAAGEATSAAGRIGSAAGRMSALLWPGGAALVSPPEGPVLAPSPEGPVLAPLPEGPVFAPDGRRLSRRRMLQAGLIGGAGVAALPLLALVGRFTRTNKQTARLAFSMNTNWLFGGRYTSGSEASSYDDSSFAPVTVPHTVVPLSWKDWNYLAWQQVWIYRRHFSGDGLLDPDLPGNRILVDFDGVMVNATVSVNDHVVATHQGGYLPFSAELTGKVTGADNLLSVVVDSRCLPVPPIGAGRGPGSVDFFQPGGIYRDVRLRVLPQVFLADLFARPTDVLGSQPRVDIECVLGSAATKRSEGTVLVQLFDGQRQIAAQTMAVTAGSPGTSTAGLSMTGFGPVSLWSPDNPRLYTVRATLNFPGIGRHTLSRRIGFREASFRPDGFFLNGKRLQLFGLNRHQLYPYAGMAMGARAQRKDAEILKNEFNCNMVRCSHYPQSPAFLDACDELGLMVWEEAPGWHNVSTIAAWREAVVRDVRDMVIRDRSRPSVIIWGTRLNECKNFPGLWAATRQAARELDGTRPSSGAMAFHGDRNWNEGVFAYNDYGTEDKTGNVALKPPFRGLPYLVSEAVSVEAVKPQHFAWTDPPAWLAHQAAMHGQAQSQARSSPGYAGLLAWAGFDYGSLLGPGPYHIKWAGVADGFRVPKPGAAIYQSQGDPAVRPVIVPVFFWEAAGADPAPGQAAMIASNCERLEVFIGGTRVASAQPATGSPLYGALAHPPFFVRLPKHLPKPAPDLLIRGFVAGQPVAELRMSAHPGGDALAMAVDDATISADGSDATRVVFRAIDALGNQRRYGSGQVALTLSGPAILLGDNPFEFGQYGGLGAVWIRSLAGRPGAITLTASHPLLGQAEVQVRSAAVKNTSELG
ncbi:MAG TPA: glycoside hydrolase family 2 TIM barrel-domain containing protein [Streptosporangiaceae bacterium]|nr:glycoside hydrolase family 2 TIM barrel-domain containing protein [Streptosporangiaceae bacterium]